MKYRKKPVVIDAIQFTGENWEEVQEFTEGNATNCICFPPSTDRLYGAVTKCTIHTLEGDHTATEGDYIIRGVHGEYYPCKPDIFKKTYEKVE